LTRTSRFVHWILPVQHQANALQGRRKFTQDVARDTARAFPGRGVVVCNVGFATTGTVESQTTVRYDARLGTTVT
jgi:hypothetical protein